METPVFYVREAKINFNPQIGNDTQTLSSGQADLLDHGHLGYSQELIHVVRRTKQAIIQDLVSACVSSWWNFVKLVSIMPRVKG